ncbi:unnamed protein product, partial [Trichobilharzia regenti]
DNHISYTHESSKEWARSIVDSCRSDLVKLGKPFKYVGKYGELIFTYFSYCVKTANVWK